jgi:monoamine oxidase
MPFATEILTDPSIPAAARQQALNRIFTDPGLPQSSTTSSFWLQSPRTFEAKAKSLPEEVDIVIVGSGITGASIARTLLENGVSSQSVLMLEARSICSGATGRNGGHILETADDYADLADAFGIQDAKKIVRFRLAHLKEMLRVAQELGITEETQARKIQFLSVYFGEEPWKAALERLRRFKEGMPEEATEWTSFEGESIPKVSQHNTFTQFLRIMKPRLTMPRISV